MTLRSAAAALVLALTIAACDAGPPRLTRPEFIERWNAICSQDERPIDALNGEVPSEVREDTLPQYARVFGEAARLFRIEIDHLSAVRPPKQDETTVVRILAYLEAAHATLSRLHQAAAAGKLEPVQTSGRNANLLEARSLAQDFGIDAGCFGGSG